MAWNPFIRKHKETDVKGFAEQDNDGQWFQYFKQYMNSFNGDLIKFSNDNAYELASNVAEIFIPIDAIAGRVSSVDFKIRNKSTLEPYEPQGNLLKLYNTPNPFEKINDLVYQMCFNELSDGNSYAYTKTPESIKNPTIDNISNIWVLKPNVTKPHLYKSIPNPFLIKSKNELIEYYSTLFFTKHNINPRYILHRTSTGISSNAKGESPLLSVKRNIDNILAVYQARYNVYSKNGNGGILSKAPASANASLQEAIDPATRDEMIRDLQNRNGITGDKNFIGISAIPMQFIKTLGTIAELQPFEETTENTVKIAGIFGIDRALLPIAGNDTYANKPEAEKSLWQNVIKTMANDRASDLTAIYYLPDNLEFYPDFSNIEALQEDKKVSLESDSVLIDNLLKLKESGQEVSNALNNLTEKYNGN